MRGGALDKRRMGGIDSYHWVRCVCLVYDSPWRGPEEVTSGVVFNGQKTRTGWTIGAGSEWKFAPNWSVFLEYDYADFGSRSVTVLSPAFVPDTITAKSNVKILLIGLNWRPKF